MLHSSRLVVLAMALIAPSLCKAVPGCPSPSMEYNGTRLKHGKQNIRSYTFQVSGLYSVKIISGDIVLATPLYTVNLFKQYYGGFFSLAIAIPGIFLSTVCCLNHL